MYQFLLVFSPIGDKSLTPVKLVVPEVGTSPITNQSLCAYALPPLPVLLVMYVVTDEPLVAVLPESSS